MRRIKKVISIMLVCILILGIVSKSNLEVFAGDNVIDYKEQKPGDIFEKPKVGMKIVINHKDGSNDTILWAEGEAFPSGNAKIGDTIEVIDISTLSRDSTSNNVIWDFQYVTPSLSENLFQISGSQGDTIKSSIELNEVGTWSFYLAVMDDATSSETGYGWWKNWSENGKQKARKTLSNGKEFWCYFIPIDIEVEELPPPPPGDKNVRINYYEVGTTRELKSSKTKPVTKGLNQIDFQNHISFEGDDYVFVNWVFNSESSKTANPASINIDDSSNTLNIYYKEDTVSPPSGDAELDFEISDVIEKRGGIFGGTYDSNFVVPTEYIKGYESDSPYYGIEKWKLEIEIEGSTVRDLSYVENDFGGSHPNVTISGDIDDVITNWVSGRSEGDYDITIYMEISGKGERAYEQESAIIRVTSGGGDTGGSGDAQVVLVYTDKKTGEVIYASEEHSKVGLFSEKRNIDKAVKLNSDPSMQRRYAELNKTLHVKKHYLSKKIQIKGIDGFETTWKDLIVRTENETLTDETRDFLFKTSVKDGDYIVYEVPLATYGTVRAYAYTDEGEELGWLEYIGDPFTTNRIDAPTFTNTVKEKMKKTIEEKGKTYYISKKNPK